MLPFYKKYSRTIFDIGLLVLTVYLFMLLFSYIYGIAKPIFWAFIIFMIIEPFARFLNRRGMKKMIATTISTMLLILVLAGIVTTAGFVFTNQITAFSKKIPEYTVSIQDKIAAFTSDLQNEMSTLSPEVIEKTQDYIAKVTSDIMTFLKKLIDMMFNGITSFSTRMMSTIINLGIGLILAFFLSIEIETWKRIAREKTPSTFKTAFEFLRENVIKGIVTYIKAQLKLVSLTFIMILASLMLLGIKNAFAIAMICAVLDILPILGVSTFFVPWIIYLFIVGDTSLAFWLTGILALILIVRQILEPKITGESLGVSAFTMLCAMIISLSLFGVMGLILSPILIILVKALYEQGYLQQWIRMPAEEYPLDQLEDSTDQTK